MSNVFLTCVSCGHTWLAMLTSPALQAYSGETLARSAARAYCVRCDAKGPHRVRVEE
jgi:hypothetical protein